MRTLKLLAVFIICCIFLTSCGKEYSNKISCDQYKLFLYHDYNKNVWEFSIKKFGIYTLQFKPILDSLSPENRQRIERDSLRFKEILFNDVEQKTSYEFTQPKPKDLDTEVYYVVKVTFKPQNPIGSDTLFTNEETMEVFK